MKYLIILLSILFLSFSSGCSEDETTDTDSSTNDTDTSRDDTTSDDTDDDSTDTSTTTSLYAIGYGEDGPCLQGGNVYIYPLITSTLAQIGEFDRFQTITSDNFGRYELPIELDIDTYPYAEVFIDAQCHNEITGAIMQQKTLSGIVSWDSNESNNINPLTTIRTPIIRSLYSDSSSSTYQNVDGSIDEAESLILAYFNMPTLTERFTNMTLQDEGTHDAVLVAVNSALLLGKTEGEQNDFMSRISQDIINGTTTHRNEALTALQNLPISDIKNNLKSRYSSLGMELTPPSFWNIIDSDGDGITNENDSDSGVELIDRVPIVKYAMNDNLSSGMFDTNDNKYFAFPIMFDTDGSSRFVITNVSADHISFYTSDDSSGFDLPDTEIVTAEKMPHDFFDTTLKDASDNEYSVPNIFSAKLDLSWTAATKYWLIMRCNDFCRPSMGSPSGKVPFGRNMHKANIDDDWVGFDQPATFFIEQKIEAIFTD